MFKIYKYYIPLFFVILLFVFIFILILPNQIRTKCNIENLYTDKNCLKDLSPTVKENLIFDKNVAKVAASSPLTLSTIYSDKNIILEDKSYQVQEVVIAEGYKEVVVITDPSTILEFKNQSGEKLVIAGSNGGWGSSLLVNEIYSQLFQKPGKFEFTINDKPIGVVRVR